MLTRAVFKKGTEPVDDQVWVALEDALTPVDLRRRLRGKVLVRRVEGSQEEDKPRNPDQGAIAKEKHLERIIQEEMTYVVHDEMEVAQQVLDATKALRGFKTTGEERDPADQDCQPTRCEEKCRCLERGDRSGA